MNNFFISKYRWHTIFLINKNILSMIIWYLYPCKSKQKKRLDFIVWQINICYRDIFEIEYLLLIRLFSIQIKVTKVYFFNLDVNIWKSDLIIKNKQINFRKCKINKILNFKDLTNDPEVCLAEFHFSLYSWLILMEKMSPFIFGWYNWGCVREVRFGWKQGCNDFWAWMAILQWAGSKGSLVRGLLILARALLDFIHGCLYWRKLEKGNNW